MKNTALKIITLITISFFLASCMKKEEVSSINPINWERRMVGLPVLDSLTKGTTYLSVYSQIYSFTEHRSADLTVTVSMRNTNRADTIFIRHADYYDTAGKLIRTYFNQPVFIGPLETVEIIIDEIDRAGGSGANFLFDWMIKPGIHEPFFEAVMISTAGSQGLSFVTEGRRVE
jgi:hypothetical protein